MITLDTLPQDAGMVQKRHRVGRGHGSGSGKTSGRGHKGAMSRTGAKRRHYYEGGQMPIYRRLPKRGFKNRFRLEWEVVNLSSLEKRFEDGQTVDIALLAKARLVTSPQARVKILGDGELTKRLTIRASAFSKSATSRIESSGGVCEVV